MESGLTLILRSLRGRLSSPYYNFNFAELRVSFFTIKEDTSIEDILEWSGWPLLPFIEPDIDLSR